MTSAEETTVLKVLSKARREESWFRDWMEVEYSSLEFTSTPPSDASSSISSSECSETFSYSAARARADAKRASMGLANSLSES